MVNRLKHLFIALFVLSLFSCAYISVPKHIKQGFTICFNGEKTNIEELINIKGYYVEVKPSLNSNRENYYLNLMFYNDGTFLYEFFDIDEVRREKGKPDISSCFKEIINDNDGHISSVSYKSFRWGCYQTKGDTIITQFVNHPASPSPIWSAWEIWYKVIDRNTIMEVYCKPIHYMSESDWKNWEKNKKQKGKFIITAQFVPVEEKPAPNCWLKKEKWFWCNPASGEDLQPTP